MVHNVSFCKFAVVGVSKVIAHDHCGSVGAGERFATGESGYPRRIRYGAFFCSQALMAAQRGVRAKSVIW